MRGTCEGRLRAKERQESTELISNQDGASEICSRVTGGEEPGVVGALQGCWPVAVGAEVERPCAGGAVTCVHHHEWSVCPSSSDIGIYSVGSHAQQPHKNPTSTK